MTTQARRKPYLQFGTNANFDLIEQHPGQSARTYALLDKLMNSVHEGALSLTGVWPKENVDRRSDPVGYGETLISTELNADGNRLPTLGNRVLSSVHIIHEHAGRKPTPANTKRLSVSAGVYNKGPETETRGMNVSLRKQGGRIDVILSGDPLNPSYRERSPQAHILGAVAATQAIRDGAAGEGGELTAENAIDYAEVSGVLHEWERVIPGQLDPLVASMNEYGYDTSWLTAPSELVAQTA